jgi:DNA mismatch repair protein MutS
MVEMVETAYILHHATCDSLIIMDEIGRGTATYDGISIAWAIAEHLVTNKAHAAKTLFATHYHELQDLEKHYPNNIKNYHMAIEEHKSNPVFLYRLTRGGAHGSYAIAVAKLAGIPENVTKRATELLKEFDKKEE